MLRKTLLTLSASVLLGAVVAAPNAALAQFGPPPGPPPVLAGPPPPRCRWSSSGLGAGGPPLGGPPAGPVAGLPPVASRPHLRARSPVVRLVSMVLADCMVSIAAARPIFAASRVAPRPTAPTATPAIVRQLWLRPSLPVLAVCGGCGLRLWRVLCLLRRRLLLRVHLQAIRHKSVLVCHGN